MSFPSVSKVIPILLLAVSLSPNFATAQEIEFEPELELQLLKLVNEERQKRGLEALAWSEELRQSARRHTEKLAETGILSHQFKGEPSLLQRIAATGLNFYASAENVGLATDWPDIHPGFMRSEGHRANILSQKYNSAGMGVLKRNGYFYVTQNFARTGEGLSVAAAEQRMSELLSAGGRPAVEVTSSEVLRNAACRMAERDSVRASSVPVSAGARGTVAFTTSTLDELPPALDKIANRAQTRKIFVGACFRATKSYPGGTYWFAVQY